MRPQGRKTAAAMQVMGSGFFQQGQHFARGKWSPSGLRTIRVVRGRTCGCRAAPSPLDLAACAMTSGMLAGLNASTAWRSTRPTSSRSFSVSRSAAWHSSNSFARHGIGQTRSRMRSAWCSVSTRECRGGWWCSTGDLSLRLCCSAHSRSWVLPASSRSVRRESKITHGYPLDDIQRGAGGGLQFGGGQFGVLHADRRRFEPVRRDLFHLGSTAKSRVAIRCAHRRRNPPDDIADDEHFDVAGSIIPPDSVQISSSEGALSPRGRCLRPPGRRSGDGEAAVACGIDGYGFSCATRVCIRPKKLADWARVTGTPQHRSGPFGSSDKKDSAPGFPTPAASDSGTPGQALWAVNINWTAVAAQMIVTTGRSGSPRPPVAVRSAPPSGFCHLTARLLAAATGALDALKPQPSSVAASASRTSKAAVSFYGYAIESETASVVADETGSGASPRISARPVTDLGRRCGARAAESGQTATGTSTRSASPTFRARAASKPTCCRTTTSRTATSSRFGAASRRRQRDHGRAGQGIDPADDLPKVKAHLAAALPRVRRLAPWETKEGRHLDDEEDALHAPEVAAAEFAPDP